MASSSSLRTSAASSSVPVPTSSSLGEYSDVSEFFTSLRLKYVSVSVLASVSVKGRVCVRATLRREPVNAMNLEVWRELAAFLEAAESREDVEGVVFSSGLTRPIFTAGNDLSELHAKRTTRARFEEFWKVSNGFLVRLLRSRLATVAAVQGSCPAGGCVMALCCDTIVMVDRNGRIGLNEVALGIAVPMYWARLFARRTGEARGEALLARAALLRASEAHSAGLVDILVSSREELLPAAERILAKLALSALRGGRVATKTAVRGAIANEWAAAIPIEATQVWDILSAKSTVAALDASMQALQKKGPARPRL